MSQQAPVSRSFPSRFWKAAGIVAGGITLVAVITGLILSKPHWVGVPSPWAHMDTGGASTVGWQTYRDPLGLFTLQYPADWTSDLSTGTGSFGNRNGSYNFTSEDVAFYPQGGSRDYFLTHGYYVVLNVMPLTNAFARDTFCQNPQTWGRRAPVGNAYANYDGASTWFLDINSAHFQINARYPGGPESPNPGGPQIRVPPPTLTPVPPAQLARNKAIMAAILASVEFTPSTPLECSAG